MLSFLTRPLKEDGWGILRQQGRQ